MFYIFIVKNATLVELENPAWVTKNVSHLQEFIQKRYDIPIENQCLMTADSCSPQPDTVLGSCQNITENSPVVVWDKTWRESEVTSPNRNIENSATRRYNDICHHFSQAQQTQSVDQLKTCFHQAAVLAESLKSEFENRLFPLFEKRLNEFKLTRAAWGCAYKHLKSSRVAFEEVCSRKLQKLMDSVNKNRSDIKLNVAKSRERIPNLQKIPVLPSLVDNKKKKYLYDWLQAQNGHANNLNKLVESCESKLAYFENNSIQSLAHSLERVVNKIESKDKNRLKEFEQETSNYDKISEEKNKYSAQLNQFCTVIRRQQSNFSSLLANRVQGHVFENSVETMFVNLKDHLKRISEFHRMLEIAVMKVNESKYNRLQELYEKFKWLSSMQYQMHSGHVDLSKLEKTLYKMNESSRVLEQLNRAAHCYLLYLIESVRRRKFSEHYRKWCKYIHGKSGATYNEEYEKREKFNNNYGANIIFTMFNGFQSRPPVVTNQTDNFDLDLPDISVQDVETIVEHCKEHISEQAFEEVKSEMNKMKKSIRDLQTYLPITTVSPSNQVDSNQSSIIEEVGVVDDVITMATTSEDDELEEQPRDLRSSGFRSRKSSDGSDGSFHSATNNQDFSDEEFTTINNEIENVHAERDSNFARENLQKHENNERGEFTTNKDTSVAVDRLKRQCTKLENELKAEREKMKSLEKNNSQLQKLLDQSKTSISTLRKDHSAKINQINSENHQKLEEVEQRVQELESKLHSTEVKLKEEEEKFTSREGEMKELRADLQDLNFSLEEKASFIEGLKEEKLKVEEELRKAEKKAKEYNDLWVACEGQVQENESKMKILREISMRQEEVKLKSADVSEKLAAKSSELAALTAKMADSDVKHKEEVQILRDEVVLKEKEIVERREKHELEMGEFEENKKKEIEELVEKHRLRMVELGNDHEILMERMRVKCERELREAENNFIELVKKHELETKENAENKIEEVEALIEKHEFKIEEINSNHKTEIEKQKNKYEEELMKMEDDFNNARDNLTGEILQVKTLEKNIGEKNEVIKNLQDKLKNHVEEMEKMKIEMERSTSELSKNASMKTDQTDDKDEQIKKLRDQLQSSIMIASTNQIPSLLQSSNQFNPSDLQMSASTFSARGLQREREKISFLNFQKDDLVLIVFDEKFNNHVIFSPNSTKYFIHTESLRELGISKGDKTTRVIARFIEKEYCKAKRAHNRFNVPVDCTFFRCRVQTVARKHPNSSHGNQPHSGRKS